MRDCGGVAPLCHQRKVQAISIQLLFFNFMFVPYVGLDGCGRASLRATFLGTSKAVRCNHFGSRHIITRVQMPWVRSEMHIGCCE